MSIRLSARAWHAIKSEYVQGRSAKELAQRFGITASAIHKRSSAGRWRDEVPVPAPRVLSTEIETYQGGDA